MMDYPKTGAGSNKNINHYAQTLTYLLGELKHVYDQRNDSEVKRKAAYERLAEISKIMRVILEKYSLLESKELLISASNLVKAVKSYDYQNYSIECHSELVDNINALYKSFQFNISNCLMKDVISMDSSVQSINPTQPPPNIGHQSPNNTNNNRMQQQKSQPQSTHKSQSKTLPSNLPEERIFAYETGLDDLLKQAKAWSKYMKEIVVFVEKRAQIESEYNRAILKNAQSLRTSIHHLKNDKAFLPFNSVYNQFCQNEIKNANICDDNFDLLIKNILAPVNEFRIEFDKQIKKIKEDWAKENKQLNDAINNYTKSREIFHSKVQEAEKVKPKLSNENSTEWNHDRHLDRLERDTRTAEADTNCTKYMLILNSQKELFKKSKRDIINRLQNLLTIIEIKIKEITSHYFETLKDSITYSPEEIQKAINDTNCYETGKSYRDFANSLPFIFQQDSSHTNHSSVISSSHPIADHNFEIDSSESDTNNSTFLMKQQHQPQHQHQHRKESKTVLMNSKQQPVNENFQIKSTEKKYKSCYGHYSISTKSSPEDRKHFFGVPLSQLSSNSVPDIIKQCVNQIEMRGSRINGIYRVSAVKSQVESLCNTYESSPNSVDLSNVSPNVIANFLKQFFRMLPEPLLTFQIYPDLIEIATKYSKNHSLDNCSEEIINQLKKICHRLPPVHYNTLKCLMQHLKQISKDCNFNQMSPSNLGIVFGPTLLKKNDDDNTALLYDTNHQSRIIELLILYSDQIFDRSQESDDSSSGIHHNSFGSTDKLKMTNQSENETRHGENGENNNHRVPQLLKSATCSSIRPEVSQFKHEISQARLKFFASSVNQSQQPSRFYSSSSYSPPNDSSSRIFNDGTTFSKIAASSNTVSNRMNHGVMSNRVKRITSVGHHLISNQPINSSEKPNNNKIYNKHNELSKSSSDIYSYKNINISITPNSNEDHV